MTPPSHHRPDGWLRAALATLGFGLLVAGGIADHGGALPLLVIGIAATAIGFFYLLFPQGMHFAFGASAGLAVYACLFVVIGRAAFPEAPALAHALAFLLPVFAFLGSVWVRRDSLRRAAEADAPFDHGHLPRMARWLIPVWVVGGFSLSLPLNRLSSFDQGLALLAAMGGIATIVTVSVRPVVLLLSDLTLITEELFARLRRITVPVVAFLTLYSLLVISFACFYRIADGLSRLPLFHGQGGPIRLSFPDALYFSLVTQATVGFGDVTPHDDGIRLLTGVQVLAGQILLLFGFAEIMRSRRVRMTEREEKRPGSASQ
ncbi:MAG: two pore domain potassium channel family protein [Roseomonas sp.]|nr:two pore domain potassium channel family protein [Roseomonas sp.]MCA3327741.1 two pore domain potassium channel family protein [Roseomonas sp.]MCA3331243.1 two pore domain potassium channel family protein [Roseomonas sp.]MCA3334759.1 two pore domain potassium channel family protein [Roseomonas sp.]MCA3348158.1 two pore domain potassium channel family protein [Roseomonas sp.]